MVQRPPLLTLFPYTTLFRSQRVALARCLVIRPAVILFDEPLSALDRGLRQKLAVDIRQLLKQTGTSAIYVTHDPDEAKTVSDRLAVIEDGKILDLGPVSTLDTSVLSDSVASLLGGSGEVRSEERRVGKEWRGGGDGQRCNGGDSAAT